MAQTTIDRHVSIVLGDGTVVDNSNPLPTSGGGGGSGTQYADGTAVSPATANAILWNDGGTVRVPSAAKPLPVNVVAGSGSGLSVQDAAAWTAGTSNFVPGGGVFNDSATALTSGQQGTQRLTPNRAEHVNLRNNSGTEIATASNPVRTDPTGTTTQPVSAASLPLPTGASVGAADEAAWTAGSSVFNPLGGVFNESAAALTSGQQGTARLTANRALQVNARDSSGNELTPATISSANSSTTPLAGNAAFTGTGEDVSRYGSVQVSVQADQSSASNGLSLQWSSDNSHWDVTEAFSFVANQAMSVRASVKGRYFRVVYTNGATIQTAFRLQALYQTASAAGTATSTMGSFTGPTPGAQFSISMPYTFDSSTSVWGPVSGAKNLTGGVAGGALPAAAGMVFNTGDSKYYPALSGAAGSGTTGIGVPSSAPLLWDSVGGVNFVKQAGDSSGRAIVVGTSAVGAAPSGNPISVATFDGTNKQHLKSNTDGTLIVGGFSRSATGTLTRPANVTAYTAQDEVGTNGTSPLSFSVSRLTGGSGIITGARLTYSSNPATTPSFRLLLFNATVTCAGDNNPLALSDADANKFIGAIDFTVTQAGGANTSDNVMMGGAPVAPITFTTDTVFGVLITTNGFTPIANSETIQIMLAEEVN